MNELVQTDMACQEDLMALESAYLTALSSMTALSLEGERLVLHGAGYRMVFVAGGFYCLLIHQGERWVVASSFRLW